MHCTEEHPPNLQKSKSRPREVSGPTGSHTARQGRTPQAPPSGLYLLTPSRCEHSNCEMAGKEVALVSVTLKQGEAQRPSSKLCPAQGCWRRLWGKERLRRSLRICRKCTGISQLNWISETTELALLKTG